MGSFCSKDGLLERFLRMFSEKLYLFFAAYLAKRRIKGKIISFTEKQRFFAYRIFKNGGFVRARNDNEKLLCAFLFRQGILEHPPTFRMDRADTDFVLSSSAQDALSELCGQDSTQNRPDKRRKKNK